jgi:hypothetical protein
MGWISLSGPHPRSQHPTSLAEALGEVPLEVLANDFNSMALLRKRTTRARTRAEHGSPRPHWVTKSQGRTPMHIQLDPISWMYPITEVVSLLSDEPGNDVDLPWECPA